LRTIPLPPVYHWYDNGPRFSGGGDDSNDDDFPGGGINYHQSAQEWTGAFTQEAETSTSLAPAKPNHIENNVQAEVSNIFTPLEIMLYNDGLDSSQTVRFRQVREAVTTALRTP
jgi:hypothetical protein